MDKMTLGQVYLRVLRFSLPVSFHQDPILIYDLGMKNGHVDAAVQRQLNPST
jgi:hypothetical protein